MDDNVHVLVAMLVMLPITVQRLSISISRLFTQFDLSRIMFVMFEI